MARRSFSRCYSEDVMLDLLMLALGIGFFAVCLAYTLACDRL